MVFLVKNYWVCVIANNQSALKDTLW